MKIRYVFVILLVAVLVVFAMRFANHRHMASKMPMSDHMDSVPIVSDIRIPNFTDVELVGERKFNENCSACHGKNAGGREGVAPPLVHKIYEPSHHGDASFQLAAKNGVRAHHWPYGNMPPVPHVTESDVNDIIAYIRSLQRANGIN